MTDIIGKIVKLDNKDVKVVRKVDTSRHDSGFQRRIRDLNGLFIVERENGDTLTAYGVEIGYTPND